jgi:hypothetical protein
MVGLGALSLALSTTPASAFWFGGGPKKPSLDLSRLPAEWVRRQGGRIGDYAEFIAKLKLTRVTPMQVIEAHAKSHGSVWNTLPPKSMWPRMAPTLKVIDRVGGVLGEPVREIVSAYRAPAYNARCSGARRGSWHQANVAVDVKFATSPSKVAVVARSLRARGYFSGGVGRYSSFTHIDTRGQNVDW